MTAAAGLSNTFGPFVVTLLQNSYGNLNTRWAYRGIFVSQYTVTAMELARLPFILIFEKSMGFPLGRFTLSYSLGLANDICGLLYINEWVCK